MVSLNSIITTVLLAATLVVSAHQQPRMKRMHDHHAVANRRHLVSRPKDLLVKPRGRSQRCKPRTTAGSSTKTAASTQPARSTRVVANVGGGEAAPTSAPSVHSTKPAPKPTSTKKAQETQQPPKSGSGGGSSSGGPSFLRGKQSGQGTYYNIAGGYTACGTQPSDSDYIAAVSHLLFDAYPGATANPNTNPICGKKIQVQRGGKSVTVTIVDRCEGCALTDVDMTPAAFKQVADMSLGRVSVNWNWL